MVYALDLSPRQSSRTLEQAIRYRAGLVLEPRGTSENSRLVGHVAAAEQPPGAPAVLLMVVQAPSDPPPSFPEVTVPLPPAKLADLIGTYGDFTIYLGENRYLFSSDIVRVEAPADGSPGRIYVSRPSFIQVAQRRKHWRFRPAKSAQVELRWKVDNTLSAGSAIGWLCNISAGGMACRTHIRVGEQLWIGDRVAVEFTLLTSESQRYLMDAVVCSKTPGGSEDKLIIGVQFLTGPEYGLSSRACARLRQQLLGSYATAVGKGARA